MEPISMTENPKIGVSAHLPNPSGVAAQKSGPETNLPTTPAGGDEKQVFSVTLRRRHHNVKKGVTACSASKSRSGLFQLYPLILMRTRSMHAAKTPSGARTKLVMLADGARHGQDRRSGAGAPLSDPSRPLARLEGV